MSKKSVYTISREAMHAGEWMFPHEIDAPNRKAPDRSFLRLYYFFLMPSSCQSSYIEMKPRPLEVSVMSNGPTPYFYNVELTALEDHLSQSIDRVARLHEKAIKRNDTQAADRIGKLQRVIGVAQQRIVRMK
jgi:hypothetical protein